jgi:TolB-like protein/tetratricopeptide (TPR) repeat protein
VKNDTSNRSCSIAVLPFDNLSGGSGQDYFAAEFVEDLIVDLSRFHSLQVISSYTSKKMAAGSVDLLAEARALAVSYLLKGSLRRKADQIRITTQLVEVAGGGVIWAERYEAPLGTIFEIQDDIVERVAGALSTQIDQLLLAAARDKPLTSLAAYDCWLKGMDLLRKGTSAADQEARKIFGQALTIDPGYSRAHAGLSLSYFNDWSCQVWEDWHTTERNAFKHAIKAIQLDDTDHITQMILGRILLYRHQFDIAEQHLNRSLDLNANDAESLIQIAISLAYLGMGEKGEKLYLKAMRLNPYRNVWYYTGGAFTYFVQSQFEVCIELALKGPLTDRWVDLPAFVAAAWAHIGNTKEAARYLEIFSETFHKKIIRDHLPTPDEMITWLKLANPFKHDADADLLVEGLVKAGLSFRPEKISSALTPDPAPKQGDTFKKENGLWHMAFEGNTIRLPEVKGFVDLARLMAAPGQEVHCAEMMGAPDSLSDHDSAIDEKARQAYAERIRELHNEIAAAEKMNDLGRRERLSVELDQLTEHLTKALGIGQRARPLNAPAERARAAVTWRIRNAIKKISAAHPALGRHLAHAVRTGTFCAYAPEKDHLWNL